MQNYFSIYGLYSWCPLQYFVNREYKQLKINMMGEILYEFTIWKIWGTICT